MAEVHVEPVVDCHDVVVWVLTVLGNLMVPQSWQIEHIAFLHD